MMTLRKLVTVLAALIVFAILALPLGAQAAKAKPPAPPAKADAAATIDINTATKEQLMAVKGIGEAYSAKIIAGRPYTSKDELWRKKILPKPVYEKVKEMLIAKQK